MGMQNTAAKTKNFKEAPRTFTFATNKRKLIGHKAELLFEDASRRFYHCKNSNKQKALKEASTFVQSMEMATGQRVAWKMSSETHYRLGSKLDVKDNQSFTLKLKKCLEYFFELD